MSVARAEVVLGLAALSGCDYLLGLDRRIDAGTVLPDDGETPGPDAKVCFSDYFLGADIDIGVWEDIRQQGIPSSTSSALVFRLVVGSLPTTAAVRTKGVFDLRANEVIAQIDMRPMSNSATALTLKMDQSDAALYAINVTPDQRAHMLVLGVEVSAQPIANFLRIRFEGTDVVFGTSDIGVDFDEVRASASIPPTAVKLELSASITGPLASTFDITWDHITVICP